MPQPVKQPIDIDFSRGLNLKADPYQVPVGNFLSLVNSVFDKVGRLTKRNGFPNLTPLPDATTSYLTTFNGDLQAIGTNLLAYSPGQQTWVEKGSTYPLELSTMTLIRNSVNQSWADSAIASTGLICTVYSEQSASGNVYKYAIADSLSGQNLVAPALIPVASGTVTNSPRVFLLGNNFILLYQNVISGVSHLEYTAISASTGLVTQTNTSISASFTNSSSLAYDAVVANNTMFIAWNGGSASGIKMVSLSSGLALSSTINPDPSHQATLVSVTADVSQSLPLIWVTYYSSSTSNGYTLLVDSSLTVLLAPTQFLTGVTIVNLTSTAVSTNTTPPVSSNTIFYEVQSVYSYDSGILSDLVDSGTVSQTGAITGAFVSIRSLGLASKAFQVDGTFYYLGAYQSPYQSTYFLVNATKSRAETPVVVAKLAYSNGGGYLRTGLPNVSVSGTEAQVPYLVKDLIQPVNKNTNVPVGTQVAGVYTQTGINLASFDFVTDGLSATEIGNNLQLTGGFPWAYDGYIPVENGFFLYPDSVEATWNATGGSIVAQPDGSTNTNAYWIQAVYQWTDDQGNPVFSAPSIPVPVTTTGTASTGTITVHVPYIRLTYKIANPPTVTIYRWSVGQQSYYQTSGFTFAASNGIQLNDTTNDSVTYIDKLPDSAILGNALLYTTGGVVEDIGGPATSITTLFDDRYWLVDSEDRNLLWYSKQVIEATPVELSDLFTFYVAPSTGAQGSTGDISALFPMDDKLIIFKEDAAYYINGSGPDNTGNNSTYSQPIFITSTVGCSNTRSLVMTPNGIMFQSNKGIWLLGRDLSTKYIGAEVEDFNGFKVTSAVAVPGTNQVRFGLDNGITLMYDYFVGQWGEFEGIPSISSTLYGDMHTIVDKYGRVSQEKANTYLDGSNPVLMSFTSSWLQLAGLRGYMRAYWFYFLGTYLSPHKLQVQIAYDYNSSAVQGDLIAPINYAGPYGSDPYYGGDGLTPYGGPPQLYNWRVFLERQRCKAFQISMQEVFDPSFGTVAGPGLTLSGLNCIVGLKKAYAPINSNQQVG